MMLWFNEVRPIEFAPCKPKQNNTQPRHAYKYFANQIVKERETSLPQYGIAILPTCRL